METKLNIPADPFSTRERAKELSEEQKKQSLRLSAAYKRLFNTDDGRIVFRDLMDFCMTFKSTMTGNSWTYFNEGKRAVGLHILLRREQGYEQEIKQLRKDTYNKEE